MDKDQEKVISELRSSVISRCAERIERAKKKGKPLDNNKEEHGVTAITKNKYLLVLISIMFGLCICTPALAATLANNTIISEQKVIDLVCGGKTLPVAYLGEYVDLSKCIGWTGQLAYWNSGDPSVSLPDITVDASTFQHRFWIDPSKFRVGTWYKWDGAYEDSSNNEAFEVKSGTRPAAVPTTASNNNTFITPVATAVPYQESNIHVLLARGDQVEYKYWNNDGRKYGSLWLFGKTESILGYKMESPADGDSMFKFPFTEEMTSRLTPGWYTGYIQFYTKRPDVSYNDTEKVLDTPYDDKIIPDVKISGLTPDRVKAEFEKLEKNAAYSDDKLVNITLEIKEPLLQFTDYYEDSDTIVVQGKSTMSEGTNASFIIDPSRYTAGYSTSLHTVTVPLTGKISEPREFSVRLHVDWDQMAIGKHEVVGTIDKLKIHISQKKEFDVTSISVNPTPTKEYVKIISSEDGWHRVNNTDGTTAVPTPTPEKIYVNPNTTPQIVYVTVYVTPVPTQTPLKNITTALPAGVRTTTPKDTESPVSPVIPLVSVVIIGYFVIRRK